MRRPDVGREEALKQLEQIITGQLDDEVGKRHAVILGGPAIGKQALLDQICCRSRQPRSPLSEGRRIARVTFGRVHQNTPASFIYRKFLHALGECEEDDELRTQLKSAYANPDVDGSWFLSFLERHAACYPEVVFLIDRLPRLLQMEIGESEMPECVLAFWDDLDQLQRVVRFVYTARQARYEELQERRLRPATESFHERIEAVAQWQALLAKDNRRLSLDQTVLKQLEEWGYLVNADDRDTAQFMARSFATWLKEHFGLGDPQHHAPQDVMIGLLSPEPGVVTTLFGERGARLLSAHKRLPPDIREQFMGSFRDAINHLLDPARHPTAGAFDDLEKVASFVLTYFTTDAIKSYLRNPPQEATILLAVDEALKDIPWELALETAYGGDAAYPFIVGRSIISPQRPQNIGVPVRGEDQVRALLIGNPTDDLDEAQAEVLWLRRRLRRDGHFAVNDEDVRIGSGECQWLSLLDTLSSGRYGLIHYSGHTTFDGYQSAWHLRDGKITTDLLTSALQNAPPALVFSSSCESGAGAEAQPARYENQTFDLPSAFLQAGVEAYIGTLWGVDALGARWFVEAFYNGFLSGHSLGKCLQQAKIAIRGNTYRTDRLAFILYGDPHTRPRDLFPALGRRED